MTAFASLLEKMATDFNPTWEKISLQPRNYSWDCQQNTGNKSWMSGHSSQTTASHEEQLPLSSTRRRVSNPLFVRSEVSQERVAWSSLPNTPYSLYHKAAGLKFPRCNREKPWDQSQLWVQPSTDSSHRPTSVLTSRDKNLFCRQTKRIKSRMSGWKTWCLLPLCILAYLGNRNLWHLRAQRAAQQSKVSGFIPSKVILSEHR